MSNKTIKTETNEKKGIVQSTLKIVAISCMFIDHSAAGILERYVVSLGFNPYKSMIPSVLEANPKAFYLSLIYMLMRLIGRIAFPLFIFCMVEGFHYTHSKLNYAFRMGIFALLSEFPFDFALFHSYFDIKHQNVYMTLLLGLLTICALDSYKKKGEPKIKEKLTGKGGDILSVIINVCIVVIGCVIAFLLKTDYSYTGIMAIVGCFIVKNREGKGNRNLRAEAATCTILTCSMPIEFTCFLTLPLVKAYNGKRGFKHKYFFYLFYPVHLLLIGIVCRLLGL